MYEYPRNKKLSNTYQKTNYHPYHYYQPATTTTTTSPSSQQNYVHYQKHEYNSHQHTQSNYNQHRNYKKQTNFTRNNAYFEQKNAQQGRFHLKKRPNQSQELTIKERNNIVAMDCEMVGVGLNGHRSALARVTIVSWDHYILFDAYIKVEEPVTDFRTFVSGIRPNDLQSKNAISMEDAKCVVKSIIKRKILVGHGLKYDLQALGISHPWYHIRDTANYFPYMKESGCYPHYFLNPRKLRDLAKDVLGWDIQGQTHGHCSFEDAIASMELYKVARCDWEGLMAWKINKTRLIEQEKINKMCLSPGSKSSVTSGTISCDDWSSTNSDITDELYFGKR